MKCELCFNDLCQPPHIYTTIDGLVIFVYLSSLPVAHLSDASRRRLVVTGDSARIQDETAENSALFFNVLGVGHRNTGPRFNISSERLLIIFWLASRGVEPTTCGDPKHCIHKSYALLTELIGRQESIDEKEYFLLFARIIKVLSALLSIVTE